MIPERNIAQRLLQRHSLSPPIDVEVFARHYADIEDELLPNGVDGILYYPPQKRPLIILDTSQHPNRRRFTIAHELGHIFIPWHVGTIGCHADQPTLGDDPYWQCEMESNSFASELLMPSRWLQSIVDSSIKKTMAAIMQEVRTAKTSDGAICIALCQILPPGYLFAEVSKDGTVLLSALSKGTAVHALSRGQQIPDEFGHGVSTRESIVSGSKIIHWWHFERGPVSFDDISESSSEILNAILRRHYSEPNLVKIRQQINGIIGSANNSFRSSLPEDLFHCFRDRFVGRPSLRLVIQDPLFDRFLRAKSLEVAARAVEKG